MCYNSEYKNNQVTMPNFLKKMFTGRMGRKEFLLPGLFFFILPFLLLTLYVFWEDLGVQIYILCLTSILLILLISLTPFIIKRLHDIGLSTGFEQ